MKQNALNYKSPFHYLSFHLILMTHPRELQAWLNCQHLAHSICVCAEPQWCHLLALSHTILHGDNTSKSQHGALSTEMCVQPVTWVPHILSSAALSLVWILRYGLKDKSKRFWGPKPSVGHCSEFPAAMVFPVIFSIAFVFQKRCSLENVLEMQAGVAVPSHTPCAAAWHPLCCPHRHQHSFSCV